MMIIEFMCFMISGHFVWLPCQICKRQLAPAGKEDPIAHQQGKDCCASVGKEDPIELVSCLFSERDIGDCARHDPIGLTGP